MYSVIRVFVAAVILPFAGLFVFLPATADDDVPSYTEAREAYLSSQAADPDAPVFSDYDRSVMQRAADELARLLPDPGIRVGEQAPDFTLNNAFGQPVHLYDRLKTGPVVLVFYRGAWCPFCNLHLRTLYKSLPEIERRGAQLILVTPQRPDKSRDQLAGSGYTLEVLSDLDSSVMQAYSLYFELDPELVAVYTKLGLNLEDFNGEGRNVLPVPGSFVIDTEGVVRAMHADTDYKERMEPAAIIQALDQLGK